MKHTKFNTIKRTAFFICMMLLSTHALQSAPFVYVANTSSNNVSVIDAANNFTTTVSLGANSPAFNTDIVTDGKTVYVPCNNSTVQLIDVATNTLLPQIHLNDMLQPHGIALAPNGLYVYVTGSGSSGSAEIQRISTANYAVETIFSTAAAASTQFYSIVIAPNSSTAYVVAFAGSSNTIAALDLTTNIARFFGSLPNQGFQIIVSPDNNFLYISMGSFIRSFDISNPQSPSLISDITDPALGFSFNSQGLAITADGKTLYAASIGSPVGIVPIDISNPLSPVVGTIAQTTDSGLQFIALTPDGSSLYVTCESSGTADLFNITNALNPTFTISIPVGSSPQGIAITPVLPPSSINGCKTKSVALLQTDYINKITWTAPSRKPAPTSYNIFRDAGLTQLIGTVPASGPLLFYDHDRNPRVTDTYYVTSAINGGSQSAPAIVTVTNPC